MKKLVHNISIRVFEKNQKDIDQTKKVLKKLLPIDFEKEKIQIKHDKAEGLNDKTIHILSMKTSKKKHNHMILDNIFNNMDEKDKKRVFNERKRRIDSDGNFFLRLDKKSLIDKKYVLTESGDCFHFTVKLAAFPIKKETIINSLESLLKKKEVIK